MTVPSASSYDSTKGEVDYKMDTEVFWRPTTNAQLSATLNPDFGNVESDDVAITSQHSKRSSRKSVPSF